MPVGLLPAKVFSRAGAKGGGKTPSNSLAAHIGDEGRSARRTCHALRAVC